MEQYIDKAAVVAEIESNKKRAQILGDNAINNSMQQFYDGMKQGCIDLLSFIDTLDMKEVDFEKIWKEYFKYRGDVATVNIKNLAKHFYELGLSVQKGE